MQRSGVSETFVPIVFHRADISKAMFAIHASNDGDEAVRVQHDVLICAMRAPSPTSGRGARFRVSDRCQCARVWHAD